MKTDRYWTYETKCRKCGNVLNYNWGERTRVNWTQFAAEVNDCLNIPRQHFCEVCLHVTVHDIISYQTLS